MSRRDTIIIAILVNAGLLLILFATAIRSGDKKKENVTELADSKMPSKESVSTPVSTEELLNEYIASAPVAPNAEKVVGQEEIVFIEDPNHMAPPSLPLQTEIASPLNPAAAPSLIPPSSLTQTPSVSPVAPPVVVNAAPALKSTPKVAASTEATKVTVKKGDYLEKIAKAHGTTVAALMKENNLTSTQLKIGQVLRISSKGTVKEAKGVEAKGVVEGDFYVVKAGDSPWQIANRLNIKLDDLLRINNIDAQKAKNLRPGDRLRIR
jgi:LysM repeat protein